MANLLVNVTYGPVSVNRGPGGRAGGAGAAERAGVARSRAGSDADVRRSRLRTRLLHAAAALAVAAIVSAATAQPLAGAYVLHLTEFTVGLELEVSADGAVRGIIALQDGVLRFDGRLVHDSEAEGLVIVDGAVIALFRARTDETGLDLTVADPGAGAAGLAAASVTRFARIQGEVRPVTVNRVVLAPETVAALEARYRTRLLRGDFWYDTVSGLWGVWGGPPLGIIEAGLALGGPLPSDASGGRSGVFVNGRELHDLEVLALWQRIGQVVPGRYWMDARGSGGVEGGPTLFDLSALHVGDAGTAYVRATAGGYIGGDGRCSYVSLPDGASVMTGPGCD
jgi:hypothetical protein